MNIKIATQRYTILDAVSSVVSHSKLGQNIPGEVIATGRPMIISDISKENPCYDSLSYSRTTVNKKAYWLVSGLLAIMFSEALS